MSSRRRPLSREEQIIRKREKEYQYQKFWGDQQKYYDWWSKNNTKYEEWTSPRYYDTNTQLVRQMQMEKALLESKEMRRNKLQKMFEEDKIAWEAELMLLRDKNAQSPRSPRERPDDIPTEILKQVHEGIKEKEEEKRKKEAELRLYHQWRNNNSFIQEYERAQRSKDVKFSWLHQQMEKRKKKEKEKEEEKRLFLEREQELKSYKEKEEQQKEQSLRRNRELREIIDKQIEEMKLRKAITEKLREKEEEEQKKRRELTELNEKQRQIDEIAKEREIALFNVKQYKIKLKQKMKNILDNLVEQEELMRRLKEMDIAERIEDQLLKEDIKESIEGFLKISEDQKRLEKLREKHLQFIFDSEAQVMYDKQSEIWNKEEQARKTLVKDILATVAEQIENNCRNSRKEQEELAKEREILIKMTEEYNEELMKLQEDERQRQLKRKEELDLEVKKKQENKKAVNAEDKIKQITEELERAKIEEERLKREIMNLHRGQGLCRPPSRSKIIF
ncbi:hypothetical protein WA026_012600 [Henosepilachna vigintioctopunctata]|uniref:Trichoplein keratin filament-binding protein n=1 Tax=Henosepilachna vigintioctopunctata TaxID=420089 RepID=A0AAW1U7R9_9CUCU